MNQAYLLLVSSNNTNKLSPQELSPIRAIILISSNNTNKLSPQELAIACIRFCVGSNNTNKLSPQELEYHRPVLEIVQIIQINLVLKNYCSSTNSRILFK